MTELSKNKIKLIKSLSKKKYRDIEQKFVCEGEKIVELLIKSEYSISEIFVTDKYLNKNNLKTKNLTQISEKNLKKISCLKTPQQIVAIAQIPTINIDKINFYNKLTIILDKIRDPGNLGTIIRIADWFGYKNIICSSDSVDAYNPKVVQATMGSIFNINIFYLNLSDFIKKYNLPIYGTFLNGKNIYKSNLSKNGFIILGNESNGISKNIEKNITHKISIPSFNKTKYAESLNIASATAIICSEFKRK